MFISSRPHTFRQLREVPHTTSPFIAKQWKDVEYSHYVQAFHRHMREAGMLPRDFICDVSRNTLAMIFCVTVDPPYQRKPKNCDFVFGFQTGQGTGKNLAGLCGVKVHDHEGIIIPLRTVGLVDNRKMRGSSLDDLVKEGLYRWRVACGRAYYQVKKLKETKIDAVRASDLLERANRLKISTVRQVREIRRDFLFVKTNSLFELLVAFYKETCYDTRDAFIQIQRTLLFQELKPFPRVI